MKSNQSSKIFFSNYIDTSVAAQNFVKLLNENQTIFLNGEWGTRKSTFLDVVKEVVAEKEKQKKFITLDLWRTQNTESLISTAFRKLVP